MKKINLSIKSMFFLILVLTFTSCDVSEQVKENSENPFTITEVNSAATKKQVTDWMQTYENQSKQPISDQISSNSFNFDDLKLVKKQGSDLETLVVPGQTKGSVKNALGFYRVEGGNIQNALMIRTKRISDTITEITYFTLKGSKLFAVRLNDKGQKATVLYSRPNIQADKNMDTVSCSSEYTLACMEDFYSNHGWFSVVLTAATLWDPAIGVSVVASCAIGSCVL